MKADPDGFKTETNASLVPRNEDCSGLRNGKSEAPVSPATYMLPSVSTAMPLPTLFPLAPPSVVEYTIVPPLLNFVTNAKRPKPGVGWMGLRVGNSPG